MNARIQFWATTSEHITSSQNRFLFLKESAEHSGIVFPPGEDKLINWVEYFYEILRLEIEKKQAQIKERVTETGIEFFPATARVTISFLMLSELPLLWQPQPLFCSFI